MPTHTFKPNLSLMRNSAVVVDSQVHYTLKGHQEKKTLWNIATTCPSPSKLKSPEKRQRISSNTDEVNGPGVEYELLEPLKISHTKVGSPSLRSQKWRVHSWLDTKRLSPGMGPDKGSAVFTKDHCRRRCPRAPSVQVVPGGQSVEVPRLPRKTLVMWSML